MQWLAVGHPAKRSTRPHAFGHLHLDPVERRVGHPPTAAADTDRAGARHRAGKRNAATARRPNPLTGRSVEVDAPVLPADEGVGAEGEETRGLARYRRGPAG
jgi:hypothetical protein